MKYFELLSFLVLFMFFVSHNECVSKKTTASELQNLKKTTKHHHQHTTNTPESNTTDDPCACSYSEIFYNPNSSYTAITPTNDPQGNYCPNMSCEWLIYNDKLVINQGPDVQGVLIISISLDISMTDELLVFPCNETYNGTILFDSNWDYSLMIDETNRVFIPTQENQICVYFNSAEINTNLTESNQWTIELSNDYTLQIVNVGISV